MKFTRGSKVEVLTKKKEPSGVWRCAEIVANDRNGYTVRYYRRPGIAKDSVDKVPVEAVRPCPPPLMDPTVWAVGDVVEVLDFDGYWRVSMIEEVLEEDYYHIHVIGSIDDFRVKKSDIRVQQEWKENKWVLMGKDSGNCEDLISRKCKKTDMQQQGDLTNVKEVPEFTLESKSLKRSSPDNPSADKAFSECVQKRRAMHKEVELDAIHGDRYSFVGQPETPAKQRKNQGKYKVKTFTKKTSKLDNANNKYLGSAEFLARSYKQDDCCSTISSVASCSINDASCDRLLSHSSACCSEYSDPLRSKGESFVLLGGKERMPVSRPICGDALRTHEVELNSYRCTLEALYFSGPLNWELEALLTDLRVKFCVSNDEHLLELRRLKSIAGLRFTCH